MRRLGTATRIGRFEPGSLEWNDARARRVGGSEVAAVLGLSPWESPFSLWWRKHGELGPQPDNDLMWWGREQEPVVAKRFQYEHPEFDVRRCGSYVNDKRDYQLINPDRLLLTRGGLRRWELLEIKHAHENEEWGPAGSDDIPVHYRCQGLWLMDTFGVRECRFAVYFGGDKYREYRIGYDEGEALILRKRCSEFIDSIDCGDIPDIDGHSATYSAIREMHPDIEDRDVPLPDELGEAYLAALRAEKAAAAERNRTNSLVTAYLGTGRRALYGTKPDGKPRSIATRIPGRGDAPPHLRANPLPTVKEIA